MATPDITEPVFHGDNNSHMELRGSLLSLFHLSLPPFLSLCSLSFSHRLLTAPRSPPPPPPLPSPNLLAVSLSVRLLLAGFNRLPFQAPLFSPPVDLL